MAKKKSSKKKSGFMTKMPATKAKDVVEVSKAPEPVEAPGKEVEVKPAMVEEPTFKVRGGAVGGVKMMTQSEFDAYCAKK